MNKALQNSFGGISSAYYFRQMFFGLLIAASVVFMALRSPSGMPAGLVLVIALNVLLYPYARFVYESVVGFVIGDNVFFVHAFLMLFVKSLTMIACFGFAIFLAPVGLLYFYVRNSRQ